MSDRTVRNVLFNMTAIIAVLFAAKGTSIAGDVPENMMQGLRSEVFKTRIENQQHLLEWARKDPKQAAENLYQRSITDEDPEVRSRCHNVLRELITDQYLKDGKGYVGIIMGALRLPAGEGNRMEERLRVDSVVQGGPADKAGIRVGDLILAVNNKALAAEDVSTAFKDKIQGMRPGDKVILSLQRANEDLEIPVFLGKLPPGADQRIFGEPQQSIEELDRIAREAYIQRWLDARKTKRS